MCFRSHSKSGDEGRIETQACLNAPWRLPSAPRSLSLSAKEKRQPQPINSPRGRPEFNLPTRH